MSVPRAGVRKSEPGPSVVPVISAPIEPTPRTLVDIESKSLNTRGSIEPSVANGSTTIKNGSVSEFRNSESSVDRSQLSKTPWRKPRTVRELASQVNEIATLVLNNQIEIETARAYAALARTSAQLMTLEVTKARYLKTKPELEFDD